MVIHKLKFATKMRNTIAPKCRDSIIYHRQTRKFQLERNLLLEHFHRSSSSRHERVTNYKLLSADLDDLANYISLSCIPVAIRSGRKRARAWLHDL